MEEQEAVKHKRMRELLELQNGRDLIEAEMRELIELSIDIGPSLMRHCMSMGSFIQSVIEKYEEAHGPVMDFFDRAYDLDENFSGLADAAGRFEEIGVALGVLDEDEAEGGVMDGEGDDYGDPDGGSDER